MNAGTPDTTPDLHLGAAVGANQYHLQVADNPDFIDPAVDITQSPLTYTRPAAAAGVWRLLLARTGT